MSMVNGSFPHSIGPVQGGHAVRVRPQAVLHPGRDALHQATQGAQQRGPKFLHLHPGEHFFFFFFFLIVASFFFFFFYYNFFFFFTATFFFLLFFYYSVRSKS